jgi:hypothetical protein
MLRTDSGESCASCRVFFRLDASGGEQTNKISKTLLKNFLKYFSMQLFKVIFPTGYQVRNKYNDNIDLNIVLENREVFFSTFFTISNIEELMKNDKEIYFWASDFVIVKDLEKETMREAIKKIIEEEHTEMAFSKIGKIENFDEIIDMCL